MDNGRDGIGNRRDGAVVNSKAKGILPKAKYFFRPQKI